MGLRNGFSSGLVSVLCLTSFSIPAIGQIDPGAALSSSSNGTTNFRFAEPNELTIVVSLLGEVQKPGRYEISRTITLLDLVALAGGFTALADPAGVTITRTLQDGQKTERHELMVDLETPSKLTESSIALQQGDFIHVGRASSVTVDRVLQYVSFAALLVVTYVTVLDHIQATP
jgi:hypothetical protein